MMDQDFDFIRKLLRERSAIVLEDGKQYLVESRLAPLVRELKVDSVADLVRLLRAPLAGALQQQVVEAMVTTETTFFRDVHPFEALRQHVLPDLIQRRSAERTLQIWSAACSSGQEAYSIIITMLEHFPELKSWNVRILGTDLSTEILDRAKEGRFAQIEANRGLPSKMLVKYFEHQGTGWQVKRELRQMVEWKPMNLVEPWIGLPRMDIVFLRNVLIYFDVPTKREILERMRSAMRPDAYLFLGAAETTMNIHERYERIPFERAACYRPLP
jgi:chemotaxis protein methyltransferase CheR